MRVLLVDDEKELVSTLAERMSFRGIEADWATSAMDALKIAESQKYDLAVLDVKMPKISGLELRKRLKAKYPDMKFIFLTGHGSENDFKVATADIDSMFYLVKPINIDNLIEKINEALNI